MAKLQSLGTDFWLVDGPTVSAMAGFHYPTRMAIVRLQGGGLWIWSPVRLDAELTMQVQALGPVTDIVAPNGLHHLSVPEWKAAFPEARTHAAPGLRDKRPDIAFDADLGQAAPWSNEIAQIILPNKITNEAVFFHRASGTVLFTDLLQQMPPGWFTGWREIVARLDGMVGAEPQVPRKFRLGFRNKEATPQSVRQILNWPARQVVMAHGTPVTEDAPAFLARAFGWLAA